MLGIWHTWERREIYTYLYMIVVGKHEEKKQVGTPSCRYEGNKRRNVKEIGWLVVNLMHVGRPLVHMTKKRLALD